MTVEEALQIANNMVKGYKGCGFDKDPQYSQQYECYKVAIEAIEKQISKKTIPQHDFLQEYEICPICNRNWGIMVNYCPECGQRLER